VVKKLLLVFLGLILPLSTLVAYAWWDQQQKNVMITDIQIGFGSRIQLVNLTTFNQGKLVPFNSFYADQNGYTTSYQFSFKITFTSDLEITNLGIEFSNILINKERESLFYSSTNEKVSCLDFQFGSSNNSVQLLAGTEKLNASYVYYLIPYQFFTYPESRFELNVEINEDLLNETCSQFIQDAYINFDVMVEAL